MTNVTPMTTAPPAVGHPRRPDAFLRALFSLFLAVGSVSFVVVLWDAIGVKSPVYPLDCPVFLDPPPACGADFLNQQNTYVVATVTFFVLIATALMVFSLYYSRRWAVIPDGLLLGALSLLVWSGITSWSNNSPWVRLAVITVALGVTLGGGYVRFIRPSRPSAGPTAWPPPAPGDPVVAAVPAAAMPGYPADHAVPPGPLADHAVPPGPLPGHAAADFAPPADWSPTGYREGAAEAGPAPVTEDQETEVVVPAGATDLVGLEQRLASVERKLRDIGQVFAPGGEG